MKHVPEPKEASFNVTFPSHACLQQANGGANEANADDNNRVLLCQTSQIITKGANYSTGTRTVSQSDV